MMFLMLADLILDDGFVGLLDDDVVVNIFCISGFVPF